MSNAVDLIKRVAEKRKLMQGVEFVAPPTQDQHIVYINGLAYRLTPDVFVGSPLCIWRVQDNTSVYVRPANEAESLRFVKALPTRKAIVYDRYAHVWARHDCPNRYYPLVGIGDYTYQNFDFMTCGYSGAVFYMYRPPERNTLSAQLRQALTQEIPPKELSIKNLTPEMRSLYSRVYDETTKSDEDRFKEKINTVMEFTGATLVDLTVVNDEAIVKYKLNELGYTVTSRIAVDTLKVLSAGMCLSGGDQNYHLQTLIPVIEHGLVNRLGHWDWY